MAAYVCILLCANLIGPSKVATVRVPVYGDVTFVAGVLFFPLSYIFGDILTEVYGYARDRRCVWAGFAALAFASFMAWVIVALPPAPEWRDKPAGGGAVFGNTLRSGRGFVIGLLDRLAGNNLRPAENEDSDPRACAPAR